MREIKFRVWEIKSKSWVSEKIVLNSDGKIWAYGFTPFEDFTDKVIINFFTGLKDKNGKEIYEGDIIHSKWEENYVGSDDSKEIVFFHNGEFVMNKSGKPEEFNFSVHFHCHPKHIKVIGNIYENHELLKK